MGFFDRFKKTSNYKNENTVNDSLSNYESRFYRRDGTSFTLTPCVDSRTGQQKQERILNTRTGKLEFLPVYQYLDANDSNSFVGKTLCFDSSVTVEALQFPEYRQLVADYLLDKNRVNKILNEYNNSNIGYAGGLMQNSQGNWQKVVDNGIVQAIHLEHDIKRVSTESKPKIPDTPVNIKTSHAEKLTPDMLDDFTR